MNDTTDREDRLLEAAQSYQNALEAGRRPGRQEFLDAHADLADGLSPYLDALDALHAAAGSCRLPIDGLALGSDALLGDFRILREIGRGGMGVVHEAMQLSLGRRVALKVLPFAAAIDAKHLQRFKTEAQAAAQLHHTNIVPVHAVGCERGVHFYAMQLIDGRSLDAVIRELREGCAVRPTTVDVRMGVTAAGSGSVRTSQRSNRGQESFRTAARLAAQVDALEYAHEAGVVHRDIKPANLLLDVKGTVWVTDFGLAHVSNDVALTQTGDMVGTLRYMSPEQASGQRVLMDHRTDIYSLGATLYELLTLQPIFSGQDRRTLLAQILNEEPRPLRQLDRSIPVELETIVLKAVAKTPGERYATARELADDLRRFLEDKPIRARRPSLAEKAAKWVRRHKSVVASAVVFLLLLVIGLSVATVLTAHAYDRERQKAEEADEQRARADRQRARADEQRDRADKQRARADKQRDRAEENFHKAWHAVDRLARIGEQELAGDPALEWLRLRLLEAALTYYQDFIDQGNDDPSIQANLEVSRDKVKTILGELTTLLGSYRYIPLHSKDVQDELKLSAEQRQAIARIQQKWGKMFAEFWRFSRAEQERQRLKLARDQEAKVAQILTPGQLQRFKQIALQSLGSLAFASPDVAKTLQLTAQQKKQILEIQDKASPAVKRFGPRGDVWRSEAAKRRERKKILSLLTPEQKQKWEDLIGPLFKREKRPNPPRFPTP